MANHSNQRPGSALVARAAIMLAYNVCTALAFSNPSHHRHRSSFGVPNAPPCFTSQQCTHNNNNIRPALTSLNAEKYEKVNEDDDQVIAFMDSTGTAGIDCYIDSYATVDGTEYTIGSPCDYAVALCYFEGDEQLVPLELDDPLMDDVFPIAEEIIEEEFGEELVLLRTPQTLTLVGELEENELDDDDEDDVGDDLNETEEEVEILISFEENGQEYHLVRLLDPVLLVGKAGNENTRILLTPEESDIVMPQLEEMFISNQEDPDQM